MSDKQRRKEIKKELKEKRNAELVAALPFSVKDAKQLFDYLDEKLTKEGCNGTFRFTEEFASKHNHNFEDIEAWLNDNGAWSDGEVLANVEQEYESII